MILSIQHSRVNEGTLERLSCDLAKKFRIDHDEAMGILFEEWETVEELFESSRSPAAAREQLLQVLSETYWVA
jgi:hypothetical protein